MRKMQYSRHGFHVRPAEFALVLERIAEVKVQRLT
jgi:hypothetical protein